MPAKLTILPISIPSRLVPGKSRARVAREMGMSVDEVARVERVALAKACAEMLRRGLTYRELISMLDTQTEYKHHAHSPNQD